MKGNQFHCKGSQCCSVKVLSELLLIRENLLSWFESSNFRTKASTVLRIIPCESVLRRLQLHSHGPEESCEAREMVGPLSGHGKRCLEDVLQLRHSANFSAGRCASFMHRLHSWVVHPRGKSPIRDLFLLVILDWLHLLLRPGPDQDRLCNELHGNCWSSFLDSFLRHFLRWEMIFNYTSKITISS